MDLKKRISLLVQTCLCDSVKAEWNRKKRLAKLDFAEMIKKDRALSELERLVTGGFKMSQILPEDLKKLLSDLKGLNRDESKVLHQPFFEEIDFDDAKFTAIPDFSIMQSLRVLHMRGARDIPYEQIERLFRTNPRLHTLYIGRDKFYRNHIDGSIERELTSKEVLHLAKQRVVNVTSDKNQDKKLDFSDLTLSKLSQEELTELIKYIEIYDNEAIKGVAAAHFTEINFGDAVFDEFPDLSLMTNLKVLHLKNCDPSIQYDLQNTGNTKKPLCKNLLAILRTNLTTLCIGDQVRHPEGKLFKSVQNHENDPDIVIANIIETLTNTTESKSAKKKLDFSGLKMEMLDQQQLSDVVIATRNYSISNGTMSPPGDFEEIDFGNARFTELPDLSEMKELRVLHIKNGLGIRLENIEKTFASNKKLHMLRVGDDMYTLDKEGKIQIEGMQPAIEASISRPVSTTQSTPQQPTNNTPRQRQGRSRRFPGFGGL